MVGKKMFLKLFVFALAVSFFAPVLGAAEAAGEVLWSNENANRVISHPPHYPSFMANKTLVVTSITTYHYHGNGGAPGTIELVDTNGKSYGKWQAAGRDGSGVRNAYWDVNINVVIPAGGTYMVKDSNVATWSYNEGTGGTGMAWVRGYVQGEGQQPTPITPTPPTPPNPPTPTGKGSEWVLVGTIRDDKEWQKRLAELNNNPGWKIGISVSANSITQTTTFMGNPGDAEWLFNGATATAELTWTPPPGKIVPNQEFSMQMSFKLLNCTAKCPPSGHQMGSYNISAGWLYCNENGNPVGNSSGMISKDGRESAGSGGGGVALGVPRSFTGYSSFDPGRKKGERRSVRVNANHFITHYIYEWR